MDDQRDVQISKRNGSSKSFISAGSAVDMEIKRKKIRQSALFLQTEEKLDFEMRMREGAYKLLLACSKREQVLNASRNLLTCNARIRALRFPLLWRDSDHFNNKGGSRRVAVFCLMQIGSEVFDTEMVVVDTSITDICFEGVTAKDVVPEFDLRVELWSCSLEEELTLVNTPKKLAKKLRYSFGKNAEKKLCSLSHLAFECSSWLPLYGNLCCRLVAQPTCMTQNMMTGYLSQKQSVEGMSRCCSLYCVLSAGFLSCYFSPEEIDAKVQPALNVPINKETRIHVSAGLRSKSLSIINPSPEGSQTVVFITDSRDELDNWVDSLHQHLYDQQWLHCCDQLMRIEVTSPRKPSLFLTKQADSVYNDLISSPSKFESITDIIHSKIEETDGNFLIGQEERQEAPNWSSLFDGSRSVVVVEKSILSQSKTSTPCSSPSRNTSSTPVSSKKRRAPPPPSDLKPSAPSTCPPKPPLPAPLHRPPPPSSQEKENSSTCVSRPATRSKTGRPSLDAKFSAIIQQLQRNNAGGATAHGRKNAPLAVLDVQPQGPQFDYEDPDPQASEDAADRGFVRTWSGPGRGPGPVPAPRSKLRKSFRERMN
uniref:Rhotekin 2 n=1 Tax=Kryptolebias marmoratus TaxID=37003 RepID=A0A3Q2ZK13_KRYMA